MGFDETWGTLLRVREVGLVFVFPFGAAFDKGGIMLVAMRLRGNADGATEGLDCVLRLRGKAVGFGMPFLVGFGIREHFLPPES